MKNRWKQLCALGVCFILSSSLLAGCQMEQKPADVSLTEEVSKEIEKDGQKEELEELENTDQKDRPENAEELVKEADKEVPEGLETMVLPMDTLMLCMYENGYAYTTEETVFWTALSYMLGLYGEQHPLAVTENGWIYMPRSAVEEYAASLFFAYDDLPELPYFLEGKVEYDASLDAYRVHPGVRNFPQAEVTGWEEQQDKSLKVELTLYRVPDEEVLCVGKFLLKPNPNGEEAGNSMFSYCVASMELGMPESEGAIFTLEGIFQGMADAHTVELLTEERVEAFQLLDDTVADHIARLQKGDMVVFRARYSDLGQGTIIEVE